MFYAYQLETWTTEEDRQVKTSEKTWDTYSEANAAMMAAIRRTNSKPELYAIGRVIKSELGGN